MERSSRVVAGLDVHKDSVFLCIYQDREIIFEAKYGVLTPEIQDMLAKMLEYGVQQVGMESTAIYWIPIWNIVSEKIPMLIANPQFIKQLPGRKSDVKDAQWIAECVYNGQIKKSFIPDATGQDLRKYNRRIFELNEDLSRKRAKRDAALQRCGMRLSNYVSNTRGSSYEKVARAIGEGQTSPEYLVTLIHGKTLGKHGKETMLQVVSGTFSNVDIECVRQYNDEIDIIKKHIDKCQAELTSLCRKLYPRQLDNLCEIPGVQERSATAIIAEIGVDMETFEKPSHLVGWTGLKPRNDESNHKIKSRKITHGNKYLRKTLIECSWGAARTKDSFFHNFTHTQCSVRHKNRMKIQVAVSRKILVAIWHMFKKDEKYRDCYQEMLKRQHEREDWDKKESNFMGKSLDE